MTESPMKKSILLTISHDGTCEAPQWQVYAWQSYQSNECLATFRTRRSAEDYAISVAAMYSLPLFVGGTHDRDAILWKLVPGKRDETHKEAQDNSGQDQPAAHVAG